MIFIKKVNAKIPTPKATAVPIKTVPRSETVPIFLYSNRVAPSIAGMERRKENFPESSRSKPQKSPVEMVAPDREIPGMMATPWAIPMRMASNHLIRLNGFPSFFAKRVSQRTNPVMRSMPPTSLGLEKKDSNQSLKRIPIRPVGMVARMIQRKSFAPSRFSSFFLSVDPIPSMIFRISVPK